MCKYAKLLTRSIDNELAQGKKEFMHKHISICPDCAQELKFLNSLRQNIVKNKIDSEPEFFWSRLKDRIRQEEKRESLSRGIDLPILKGRVLSEKFAFDFIGWTKRLMPFPILAGILIVIFLNLNPNNNINPVDEYLFTNQDSNVLELIETAGPQSEIRLLLY